MTNFVLFLLFSRRYLTTYGTFRDEPLPDLPGEDGRILAFVLLNFADDGRRGHFGLGATDDARGAPAPPAASAGSRGAAVMMVRMVRMMDE